MGTGDRIPAGAHCSLRPVNITQTVAAKQTATKYVTFLNLSMRKVYRVHLTGSVIPKKKSDFNYNKNCRLQKLKTITLTIQIAEL